MTTTEELRAENARLRAAIEKVRAARSNHPKCDVHADDDPVKCGWKRAVLDIDAALATEPTEVGEAADG